MKIDLTGAKVGEKFVLTNGLEAELILRTSDALILNSSGGITVMVDNQGESQHSNSGLSIKSKHVPRPWLKDLPDADLFELFSSKDIQCDSSGVWFDHRGMSLNTDKMPKLTGDQWKDSKITIVDLKAWQLANDLQSGIAGFGCTVQRAIQEFKSNERN